MKKMKKTILIVVAILVLGIVAFAVIPWGNYESQIEKSTLTTVNEEENSNEDLPPTLNNLDGKYKANEKNNAEILFNVDGMKSTKGAFEKFNIEFNIQKNMDEASISVEMDVNTINTKNKMRDSHLMEEDFFNAKKYPKIKFISDKIKMKTYNTNIAEGKINFMGKEQDLSFEFTHIGAGKNKEGIAFEAFEGSFEFDRVKYGMEESKGVGNLVTVNFYCELVKN